jgi:hypothetical protein
VLVLLRPATVVQWHRQGFRFYWCWRSRSGRPSVDQEVRALVRQMSNANPLWGAPRIHGEVLKLGFKISQATVAKYMVLPGAASCTIRLRESPPLTCSWWRQRRSGSVRDGHPASPTQEDCTI